MAIMWFATIDIQDLRFPFLVHRIYILWYKSCCCKLC